MGVKHYTEQKIKVYLKYTLGCDIRPVPTASTDRRQYCNLEIFGHWLPGHNRFHRSHCSYVLGGLLFN